MSVPVDAIAIPAATAAADPPDEPPDTNFLSGNTLAHLSTDSMLYNEEAGKLVVGIGLEGLVVVNTKDALLVCHKDQVPEIKAVLKKIEEQGLQNYL